MQDRRSNLTAMVAIGAIPSVILLAVLLATGTNLWTAIVITVVVWVCLTLAQVYRARTWTRE